MNKDEIVRYVMNTPGNTNEQILRLALDGLEGDSGHLYQHQITISNLAGTITTEITNTKSTPFTKDEFITFLSTPLKTLRCFCCREESQGVQWYIYKEMTLEWSEMDEEYDIKLYGGLEIYFSSGSIAMEEEPQLSITNNTYDYTCPIDNFSDVVIQL